MSYIRLTRPEILFQTNKDKVMLELFRKRKNSVDIIFDLSFWSFNIFE